VYCKNGKLIFNVTSVYCSVTANCVNLYAGNFSRFITVRDLHTRAINISVIASHSLSFKFFVFRDVRENRLGMLTNGKHFYGNMMNKLEVSWTGKKIKHFCAMETTFKMHSFSATGWNRLSFWVLIGEWKKKLYYVYNGGILPFKSSNLLRFVAILIFYCRGIHFNLFYQTKFVQWNLSNRPS
jgi:hypothetical protein